MQKIIILFLLFFLPFIVGTFGISFYESPKIIASQLAIDALIVYALLNLKNVKKYKPSIFDMCLFGIFLLTFIQILLNPNPLSFYGNEFRKQGIFLLWHLLAFAFIVSKSQKTIIPNHKILRYIPHFSFLLLIVTTFFFGTTPDGRAVGVFGEPNSLGLYSVFLWPFVHILAAPFAFLIILLSGSRSAFIAFFVQLIFIFMVERMKIKTKSALLLCTILIAGSLYLPFLEQGGDYQNRAIIWQTALDAGLEKPFLGHGFGMTELAIKEASFRLENNIRFEYIDSAHNIFLDWFIQGGFVGIIGLTALVSLRFIIS
jgi:O-antigen ligase